MSDPTPWNPSVILYALCTGGAGLLMLIARAYIADLVKALRENTTAVGEMKSAFVSIVGRIETVEKELEKRATKMEVEILTRLVKKHRGSDGPICEHDD